MKICNCDQKARERFDAKVLKTATCWLWTGETDYNKGYGRVNWNAKAHRAHRWSYALHYGEFDSSLMVLHKCDVKLCVRPDHLFLGTAWDNNKDMEKKGRAWWQNLDKVPPNVV